MRKLLFFSYTIAALLMSSQPAFARRDGVFAQLDRWLSDTPIIKKHNKKRIHPKIKPPKIWPWKWDDNGRDDCKDCEDWPDDVMDDDCDGIPDDQDDDIWITDLDCDGQDDNEDADCDGTPDWCDDDVEFIDDDCNGVNDACEIDTDCDGIPDFCDNCPDDENEDQTDSDDDGIGDVCDNDCPMAPGD